MSGKGPLAARGKIQSAVDRSIYIKLASLPLGVILTSILTHKLGIEFTARSNRILKECVVRVSDGLVLGTSYGIVVLHDTHSIKELVLLCLDVLLVRLISLRLQ